MKQEIIRKLSAAVAMSSLLASLWRLRRRQQLHRRWCD